MDKDKVTDNFNKLQWSKFVGQEQYVVRSSSMTEFIDLIEKVKSFLVEEVKQEREAQSPEAPPWEAEQANTKLCPVHQIHMSMGISKKTGKPYFSHKDENGSMCFGKGSLPPLDRSKYGTA